jgi:mannose-6-phosphate isomerase
VWGRPQLPEWAAVESPGPEPVGEIWFEDERGDDAELLVKYLFTSERLSIQVHPGNEAARAAGYRRGKDEAWLVLEADPDAEIGIGLTREVSSEELRSAALDGSIEQLLDRRPVKGGDVFYSPAGTIHAIGPGLVLLEIQQNVDLTYRLYDYGRPRELHLDEGVAAAVAGPFRAACEAGEVEPGRELIAGGCAFALERWQGPWQGHVEAGSAVLIPMKSSCALGGEMAEPGTVWSLGGSTPVEIGEGAELLVAYERQAPVTRS